MPSKINWEGVAASAKAHWKAIAIVIGVFVLLGGYFFLSDRIGDWWDARSAAKVKAEVQTIEDRKVEINKEIQTLQSEKDNLNGQIVAKTEDLNQNIAVGEELKKETAVAIENYKKAVAAGTDTDRTAQDLIDALAKLEAAQK